MGWYKFGKVYIIDEYDFDDFIDVVAGEVFDLMYSDYADDLEVVFSDLDRLLERGLESHVKYVFADMLEKEKVRGVVLRDGDRCGVAEDSREFVKVLKKFGLLDEIRKVVYELFELQLQKYRDKYRYDIEDE